MPLINRELFVEGMLANPNLAANMRYILDRRFGNQAQVAEKFRAKPDRESALKLLDALGNAIKNGAQMHKALRPWDINAKMFDALDRTQPWWGWEFETGWKSEAARKAALEHAWDNYDGVMFDGEGEGNWQVEITFTPAEARSHFDGTAPARQFVEWMSKNPNLIYNGGTNNVGTHLNMSHPGITSHQVATRVAKFMNRTIIASTQQKGANLQLFGRELLYGGFYQQSSNGGKNNWVEFKGYRTTYDLATFDSFLKSAAGLQVAMDYFLSLSAKEQANLNAKGVGMTNLLDVVTKGAAAEYGPVKANEYDRYVARGHIGDI